LVKGIKKPSPEDSKNPFYPGQDLFLACLELAEKPAVSG